MSKERLYAIGIDVGGTNVPASIVNVHGKIIYTINKKTTQECGTNNFISSIVDSIKSLTEHFNQHVKDGQLIGVGIGAAGILDLNKGEIITSPNLPLCKNIHIVKDVKKEIKLPVFLDNDANCATIGEHWIGAAKGCANVVLLTLGTGIGGGIIIDNKIYRGSHGTAGEIGHMTIFPNGNKCGCGNTGCFEAYASANAVVVRAKEILKTQDTGSILRGKKEITAHDIFLSAESGDNFSKSVLIESGRYLGIGIANLANIFDPDMIIVGGGFASAEKYLIPAAINEAYKRSFKSVMDKIKITKAKLGNDAGIIGAAKLAF